MQNKAPLFVSKLMMISACVCFPGINIQAETLPNSIKNEELNDQKNFLDDKDFYAVLPEWLDRAVYAAEEAGKVLRNYFGKIKEIDKKSSASDFATEADKKSEEVILKILQNSFPTHAILAEESGTNDQISDFVWMVDPLDGTTNYTHTYPMCAISIGLTYKGKPILGVVYNPINQELFTGIEGQPSKLNGLPIHVSQTDTLEQSLLATGFPYVSTPENNNFEFFCKLTENTHGVRRDGSAALDLAYVACGRLDGYWEGTIKPWDIAAGIVILKGAGGQVTHYNLEDMILENGKILATNGLIHQAVSHALSQ